MSIIGNYQFIDSITVKVRFIKKFVFLALYFPVLTASSPLLSLLTHLACFFPGDESRIGLGWARDGSDGSWDELRVRQTGKSS